LVILLPKRRSSMEIIYSCKERELFSNLELMKKKLKIEHIKMIVKRVNELKAFNNFQELLNSSIGKPERLTNSEYYSLRIDKNYRLIIKPVIKVYSAEEFLMCESIEIKGVVDYHGGKNNWIIK